MLKPVSNRNFLLACSADCPADNHVRQLALFLYGTLAIIMKKIRTTNWILVAVIIIAIIFIGYQYQNQRKLEEENLNLKTKLADSLITTEEIENFDEFLYNFSLDTSYQINRIKFPVKLSYRIDFENYNAPLLDTIITLKKWKHDDLFYDQTTQVQIFDNFEGVMRNTKERVVHFRGVENGRDLAYYFEADKGSWYLTKIINKTD